MGLSRQHHKQKTVFGDLDGQWRANRQGNKNARLPKTQIHGNTP
jgi:hypothetical protein